MSDGGLRYWQEVGQWQEQIMNQRMFGSAAAGLINSALPTRSQPHKDTNMAKISEMLPSNYLKQSDFPEDYICTIRSIERKNIAMDGKPAEYKWLAHYEEFEKPMVLNSTNIQLMGKALASDDTDDWIGKQIIVYVDENVSFGGELVGGLRIRKHKQAAPTPPVQRRPAAASAAADPFGDDL